MKRKPSKNLKETMLLYAVTSKLWKSKYCISRLFRTFYRLSIHWGYLYWCKIFEYLNNRSYICKL